MKTVDGAYSRVYTLGHKDDEKETQFLRIETVGHSWIEITVSHLLHINGEYLKASKARIGDRLTLASNQQEQITNITKVTRKGFYAPKTMVGDLLVSRIQASSYSVDDSIDETVFTHGRIHLHFLPLRMLCGPTNANPELCEHVYSALYRPLEEKMVLVMKQAATVPGGVLVVSALLWVLIASILSSPVIVVWLMTRAVRKVRTTQYQSMMSFAIMAQTTKSKLKGEKYSKNLR